MLEAGCPALGGPKKTIIKRVWDGVSEVIPVTDKLFSYHNENSLTLDKMRICVVSLKNFFLTILKDARRRLWQQLPLFISVAWAKSVCHGNGPYSY